MTPARTAGLLAVLAALLVAACGRGEPSETSASATAVGPAVRAATPVPEVFEVNGFRLVPPGASDPSVSPCAGFNLEGPYFGSVVFEVKPEDLPDLGFESSFTPRICHIRGVVGLVGAAGDVGVELVSGPRSWPVQVGGPSQVQALTVAGRPAIAFLHGEANALLVQMDFGTLGLIATNLNAGSGELQALARAVVRASPRLPNAKPTFTGTVNGIRLYSQQEGGRRNGCEVTQYGNRGNPVGLDLLEKSALAFDVSRLPAGFVTAFPMAYSCGGAVDLYTLSVSDGARERTYQYFLARATGEVAWSNIYSEGWIHATTVRGHRAVLTAPPSGLETDSYSIIIEEPFGVSIVRGPDLDAVRRIAEAIY